MTVSKLLSKTVLFYTKQSQLFTLTQLSTVLFSLHTKLVPINLHNVTASGISVIITTCFVILLLFNPVLIFKIAFTGSALILLSNFSLTTFIWLNTRSISTLECSIAHIMCIEQKQPVFCMGFLRWHLHGVQTIETNSLETIHLRPLDLRPRHLRPVHLRPHSFETTFIWDLFIWDHIHLSPYSLETTFIWDHVHLRPRSFETTVIWDHIHLKPHSFETTFIWDHSHLRPHSFEITFIWDHIHFRPHSF